MRRTSLIALIAAVFVGSMPAQVLDAVFISHDVPPSMPIGGTAQITMEVQNLGTAVWDEAFQVVELGSDARLSLAPGATVAPGEIGAFTGEFTLPEGAESPYLSLWQMTQGGTVFFGEILEVLIERDPTSTIPINPVEERTIHIAAATTGATIGDSTAVLAPGPESVYPLHRIEIPGFQEVAEPGPGVVSVTIRGAALFERYSSSGQSFPFVSVSLIVVETRDAAGEPVAFGGPVNMRLMFTDTETEGPIVTSHNDVTDFGENLMSPLQMRLVWDALTGPDVDYQFYGGPGAADQTVNPTAGARSELGQPGTVTIAGVEGLTGADGLRAWALVADPNAPAEPSVGELLGHLLGRISLSGGLFDAADLNGDGLLDAADVVSHTNGSSL